MPPEIATKQYQIMKVLDGDCPRLDDTRVQTLAPNKTLRLNVSALSIRRLRKSNHYASIGNATRLQ
jgi:hypothetical protein